jgi:putative membrane protein
MPAIDGVTPGLDLGTTLGRLAGIGRWGEDPWSLVPLALALGLYIAGLIWLWRKAGSGRGISFRHAAAFGAGWLILAVALQSPLHFWGERMFSAHMVEHEIVMVVAAPLLVVSRPLIPFLWAMPIAWRRKLGGMRRLRGFRPIWEGATRPLTAWIAHAAVLWVWHIPAVFRAALASEALHAVQHLCFLAAALLYWWSLLCRREGADMQGAGVVSLFATSVQTALLGALLTLSSAARYGADPRFAAICGLTPLEDQQLAGLIMWVPAGLTYVGAALVLMLRLFGAAERRAQLWIAGLPPYPSDQRP